MSNRTKKLNNRGMTLVEVVASVAILAIISVGIYNGTSLLLKGYKIGQFVYESNSVLERRMETETVAGTNGTATFKVGGSTVTVSGKYHSDSETRDNMTISYTMFRP